MEVKNSTCIEVLQKYVNAKKLSNDIANKSNNKTDKVDSFKLMGLYTNLLSIPIEKSEENKKRVLGLVESFFTGSVENTMDYILSFH